MEINNNLIIKSSLIKIICQIKIILESKLFVKSKLFLDQNYFWIKIIFESKSFLDQNNFHQKLNKKGTTQWTKQKKSQHPQATLQCPSTKKNQKNYSVHKYQATILTQKKITFILSLGQQLELLLLSTEWHFAAILWHFWHSCFSLSKTLFIKFVLIHEC